MTQVLDWQNAADPDEVVNRAVQSLTEGQLVAFPTETVYGVAASGLIPEAVERLRQGKGRPADKPLALAVRGLSEALKWVPGMGPLGQRLARRCWPGPVTLVFPADLERGLGSELPQTVRRRVCPTGTLGLRVPAHEAISQALQRMAGPLVLTSANRSGEPAATRAEEVVGAVGDDLAVIIDAGPSLYGRASTVVQVNGDSWKVLRQGVVPPADIRRRAAFQIAFVCTGNTCRSPLAEGLCKKLLAERLGCSPEKLSEHGFVVESAGLTALPGAAAAAEAVEAGRELGADLSSHASRPLTEEWAAQVDYLVAMTRSHLLVLAGSLAGRGPTPRLLSPEAEDIPDPIGGDQQVYRECAWKIDRHLDRFLSELQEQGVLPPWREQ
jgi:protein-tyrosine phosphatase